jgi:putative transposase
MPRRRVVLATGEYYHLINRGNASQPTFLNIRDYQRFLTTINYYQHDSLLLRLSKFLLLSKEKKAKYIENLIEKGNLIVNINCFCLMPNHFHLLIKQAKDKGISKFMSQLQNSYTKYFNVKRKRIGSVFQGQFKAVRVETDEQLIHLSRYIHLNPYSSFVVKSKEELQIYPWSSLPDYLGKSKYPFLKKKIVSDFFESSKRYQKFIFDQADYQRSLEEIKHLAFDRLE